MKTWLKTLFVGLLGLLMVGCGTSGDEELVVYSGRSQPLVDEIVSEFNDQSDVDVTVKYGKDAQLLAAMKEEGNATPADVFWANTTGALGNAVDNNLLTELPGDMVNTNERFVPSNRRWVPITTRFRVLAYNSDRVDPADLPDSVKDLPDVEGLDARIGWTPTYSSFQDFLTVFRQTEGKEAVRQWVSDMTDQSPKSYTSNTPMIQALEAGEIDVALTNHYYVLRLKHGGAEGEYEGHEEDEEGHEEEEDEEQPRPDAPVETYRFEPGDPGNLALVTGAGVVSSSDRSETAREFIQFLRSEQAQRLAAERVNEYPVVPGVSVPEYMLPVEEALRLSPEFEPGSLSDLEPTLQLLRDEGIL